MDAAQATRRRTRIVAAALAAVIAWPAGPLPGAGAPPAEAAFPGGSGRIAFESNLVTANNPTGDFEIFSMNPNGTDVRQLTSNTTDDRFPAWSPDGTKIAFASGANHIAVMDFDGANPIPLTTAAGQDALPAWSPDGATIAFTRFESAQTNIHTMNASGANQTRLTNTQWNSFPDWSPDGATIAFETTRDGGFSVYTMRANGANQGRLGPGRDPNWSPDGTKIAFYQQAGTQFRNDVFVMNANGTSPVNLTNTPAENEYEPAWSPDGAQIAFVTDNAQGFGDIFTMDADGANGKNRTNDAGIEEDPAWQPISIPTPPSPFKDPPKFTGASDVFVFSSDRRTAGNPEGDTEIFKMELRLFTGPVVTQLTSNVADDDNQPEWSADGRKIAFIRNRSIFTMNADGSDQVRVTQAPNGKVDIQPTWSPDGTKIAFSSDRGNSSSFRQIWVVRSDGSNLTQLTNPVGLESDSGPDWSPDGTTIVFDRLLGPGGGIFCLFTVKPDGSDLAQRTFPSEGNSYDPAWSPDGKKIAFIRNATSLYRMTPDGANQRQILKGPDGPSDVRWSPDGRELVFAGFAANGAPPNEIYTVKANGTSLTNRTNNLAFDLVPDWSPNPSQSAAAAARAKHDRQDAHGKGGKGKHKQDGANARHRHRAGRNGGHLRHQGKDRQNTEATSGQPRTARNRQGQHGQRGK